jgi:hypothetical protein
MWVSAWAETILKNNSFRHPQELYKTIDPLSIRLVSLLASPFESMTGNKRISSSSDDFID